MSFPGERPNVVIPTPSIRITLSLRVPAALSVEGFLLVRYVISGIAISRLVKYRRLVAFIVYLKTTIVAITSTVLQYSESKPRWHLASLGVLPRMT